MARLQEYYETMVRPNLLEEFKYSSTMQVPKLEKIVISSDGGAEFGAMKKIKPSVQVETATAKPMGLDDIMAERQTKLKSLKPLEPLPVRFF